MSLRRPGAAQTLDAANSVRGAFGAGVREWLFRAALTTVAAIFALLLVEGFVRLLTRLTTPTLLVLDRELGWAHRANARRLERSEGVEALVETNALGFRGPLHVGVPFRGGQRVLILGDSFAEGRQVSDEDLFSVRIERAHPELELVNAGVMGYGTVQEAVALKRWEPVVQPALAVLMVYRNDLADNVSPFAPGIGPRPYAAHDGAFHALDWQPFAPWLPPIPGRVWFYRNSIAMQLWQRRRIGRVKRTQLMSSYSAHWRAISRDIKWHVLEVWIGAIAEGHRLLLVACPERHDVERGDRNFTEGLAAVAARHGVPFVNLQDVLNPDDFLEIHWSARGQRAVAAELGPAILRLVTS